MVSIRDGMKVGGYEILRFIGKGGMGEIWLAKQTSIGREVALKILSPTLVQKNPKFAERFIAEAQAAGRLNHPNIIGVHDVGRVELDGDLIHYFSMEYVDGENYRQILDRDGPIDADAIGKVMAAMADALSYAHGIGMIHRDIKPENIMITRDGRVKLADFGLAMQVDSAEASEVERDDAGRIKVMGTPLYMSPEQARGRQLDFRSDLYSLGATLFHFLCGRPPYRRPSSKEVMRAHVHDEVPDPTDVMDCPESWRHLCMQLMAKDPADRADSPEAFRQQVQDAITHQHEAPRRRRHATSVGTRHRKGPGGAMGAVAVLALVLVVGLGVVIAMTRGGPPSTGGLPDDPVDNPSADPEADREARVAAARAFIQKLPDDHKAALDQLAGSDGLRNAYFIAEPTAMTLLRDKERQLRAALKAANAEHLEALKGKLDAVEQQLRGGQLSEARTGLDTIPERDRTLLRSRWDELDLRVERELDYLADGAVTEIKRSTTIDAIQPKVDQAKTKGLFGERLKTVEEAAKARTQQLKRAQRDLASQQKELLRQQWRQMVEGLNADRRAADDDGRQEPDYRGFQGTLRSFRPRFTDEQWRLDAIDSYEQVCTWAEELDRALVAMLRKQPYRVHIPLPAGEARGQVVAFDRGRFTIEIEWPQAKLMRPIDSSEVPLEELLERAAADAGQADVPQRIAAFHWMWNLDQAIPVLTGPLRESHMTQQLARIDAALHAALSHIDRSYDFARAQRNWLDEFESERISLSEGALRFAPVPMIPFTVAQFRADARGVLAKLREAHLDTMRYKQSLQVPIEVEATVQLYPNSKALIGFEQDGSFVRLYADYPYKRTAVLTTADNQALTFGHAESNDKRVLGEMRFTLTVDDTGKVEYRINGDRFSGLDGHGFDPKKPLTLVIQDLHLKEEAVGHIDIRKLEIDAQRP